jgi:tetratricopeptide (TPR) repeat protein
MVATAKTALVLSLILLPTLAAADDARSGRRRAAAGDAEYKSGDFQKALSDFEEAYRILNEPALYFHIANCHRSLNHTEEAIRYYSMYLEEVPTAANAKAVRKIIAELKSRTGTPAPGPKPAGGAAAGPTAPAAGTPPPTETSPGSSWAPAPTPAATPARAAPSPAPVTPPPASANRVPPPPPPPPAVPPPAPSTAAKPSSPEGDPFLPSLAVVGVFASDKDDADAAGKLGALLADMAGWSGHFADVIRPDAAAKSLGNQYAGAVNCGNDASCYGPLHATLGSDRLVVGTLSREGISYQLRIVLYDSGLRSTDSVDVESVSLNTDEIAVLLPDPYNGLLERGAGRRAKLSVAAESSGGRVKLSGIDIGAVPITKYVVAGTYTVRVERPDSEPYEEEVTLQPDDQHVVEAVLKKSSGAAAAVTKSASSGPPAILYHPGLYTAVAGAAAVGVGIYCGVTAKSLEAKGAVGSDGIRGITPVQAAAARIDALLANIFIAAGAAVIVGSGIWIVVSPSKANSSMAPGRDSATALVGYSRAF